MNTTAQANIDAVQTAVVEFDRIAAGIAALEAAHPKNVACDLTSPSGMKQAVAGRAAWRTPRLLVEKTRVAAKAPVLALGREIDAFAKELEARLLEGESNYDEQIKAVERQRAAEAQHKADEEAKRIRSLQEAVAAMRDIPPYTATATPATIDQHMKMLTEFVIDARYEEFQDQAHAAKTQTLALLGALRQAAVARETETARIIELDRLRAEAAVREQAAAQDQAREQARITAEQAAEQQRLNAEAAVQRQERERVEAEQRAENDRQAKARAEIAARERAQQAEQVRLVAQAAALHAQELAAKETARVEREQDAYRVRAAAPLLLAALIAVRDWDTAPHMLPLALVAQIDDAIAAAEGTPTEAPLV